MNTVKHEHTKKLYLFVRFVVRTKNCVYFFQTKSWICDIRVMQNQTDVNYVSVSILYREFRPDNHYNLHTLYLYCVIIVIFINLVLSGFGMLHTLYLYCVRFNCCDICKSGRFRIWNMDNFDSSEKLLPHPGFVYTAKFHPRLDSVIATGGYDQVIRVWDVSGTEPHGVVSSLNFEITQGLRKEIFIIRDSNILPVLLWVDDFYEKVGKNIRIKKRFLIPLKKII